MTGALLRYRVLANVVGVLLVVLVFVAVPLKYWAGSPGLAKVVGVAHGFLYLVYLVSAAELARRARLSLVRTLLMLVAGLVPFLCFVIERSTTRLLTR